MKRLLAALVAIFALGGSVLLPSAAALATPQSELSGMRAAGPWVDSQGNFIRAHSGSIVQVGSTFYWVGHEFDGTSASNNVGVNCYSSTDLSHWTNLGRIVTGAYGGSNYDGTTWRPHLMYNATTGKYVLWVVNAYRSGGVPFVYESSSPCSGYGAASPGDPNSISTAGGRVNGDMGTFIDTNGDSYFVSSNVNDRKTSIYKLTSDYTQIASLVVTIPTYSEAPTMFTRNGYYYIASSGVNGYNNTPTNYVYSTSISSGWSSTLTSLDNNNSQVADIFTVNAGGNTNYYMLGDRWINGSGDNNARYTLIPLSIDGPAVKALWDDDRPWSVDTANADYTDGVNIDDRVIGTGVDQFNYSGSGWQSYNGCGYEGQYDCTISWTTHAGDAVTLPFSGSEIRLYGLPDPNSGIGSVQIGDGSCANFGTATNVDWYTPSRAGDVLLATITGLDAKPHCLKLTATGTKDSSSTGYTVAPDRVDITPNRTDVDDRVLGTGTNQLNYTGTGWQSYSGCGPEGQYDCTISWSSTANDGFTFKFSGTRAVLYGLVDTNSGYAGVSIGDGTCANFGPESSVNFYDPNRKANLPLWVSDPLAAGNHCLKFRVTGSKDAISGGAIVAPDRIQISG